MEEVIDRRKEELRTRHIRRMQKGECSLEVGFVWTDTLTDLERVADHCSNIAGCVIDAQAHNLNLHETLRKVHGEKEFRQLVEEYGGKYRLEG